MNNPFYIVDVPLPASQDFDQLKGEGLALIQTYSGSEWTNLNPSDPGVTILDQLCYALTELGYCIGFSMADMLTGPEGYIRYHDQFYMPEEILTTSPVTVTDYRKYVIDGVDGVNNLVILPQSTSNVYAVYLFIDPAITDPQAIDQVCTAAYFCLNKSRNMGELFMVPEPLKKNTHLLSGLIEIEKETDLNNILAQIDVQICNYIFPTVAQRGYVGLGGPGKEMDQVFEGPYLNNGWIDTGDLGEKKDVLRTIEVSRIIKAVQGVHTVSTLNFDGASPAAPEIVCQSTEILVVDILGSVKQGLLQVYCQGRNIGNNTQLLSLTQTRTFPAPDSDLVYGAKADIHAGLPKGKFRDINTYYSIQNTFPEIFGVGANSVAPDAGAYQVAQSRQLKGYLTLFDQVLANQFSQLANIGRLFSFKNSLSGAPSDVKNYYAVKDQYQKIHQEYPVPYKVFSPTYFYQSLYDIPCIQTLLKDHDAFKTSLEPESDQDLETKSWTAYKQDPYNAYMHGLMVLMEDENTSLTRRNQVLDHLLARHGESPLVINAAIDGSKYSGESLRDQVIFKSLYLQNYGLLSYYRQKAYNFQAAEKISGTPTEIPGKYEQVLMQGNFTDFIFDSGKIDEVERLTRTDFINYSGIELKLSLLLGLKTQYKDYIVEYAGNPEKEDETSLAFWMIEQRKGLIFFETALLFSNLNKESSSGVLPGNDLEFIFPDFIPQFSTSAFQNRLTGFLDNVLPVQLSYTCRFLNAEQLKKVVPAFADWHNSLIYQEGKESTAASSSAALYAILTDPGQQKTA